MHIELATETLESPSGLENVELSVNRKLPVSDQIYEALRTAIVRVQLLPGASISENSIGRRFGVSRTPIRSAIQRLAEEGLIDVFPQQGSFVSPIKLRDIHDSHFVRRSLELSILAEAARLWSADRSAEARRSIAAHKIAIETGGLDGFLIGDEEFHRLMTGFANREGVWSSIAAARARLMRFLSLFGSPERLPIVITEHLAIIDALDAGDQTRATQALTDHLDKVFKILEQVPEKFRHYLTG